MNTTTIDLTELTGDYKILLATASIQVSTSVPKIIITTKDADLVLNFENEQVRSPSAPDDNNPSDFCIFCPFSHCNCGVNMETSSNAVQSSAENTSEEQRTTSAVGLSDSGDSLVLNGPLFRSIDNEEDDEDALSTVFESTEPPSRGENDVELDDDFFSSLLSENAQANEAASVETSSQGERKRPARSDSTDHGPRTAKKQAKARISRVIEDERTPSVEISPVRTPLSGQKTGIRQRRQVDALDPVAFFLFYNFDMHCFNSAVQDCILYKRVITGSEIVNSPYIMSSSKQMFHLHNNKVFHVDEDSAGYVRINKKKFRRERLFEMTFL